MKRNRQGKQGIMALALFLAALLAGGCGGGEAARPGTDWGRADAKEIDVHSKIAGRVVELLVEEGDAVEAGQLLARIDKRDLLAQKAQLEAQIEALRAQQAQAAWATAKERGTTDASLSQAQAAEEQARADLELAQADYGRHAELVQAGAVSRQLFEQYRTRYQVAQAAYRQAQEAARQADAALLQTDVNLANEAALAHQREQAEAVLAQLMVSLDETDIRAPFAGIVTAKYVEEGSMVSLGTPLAAVQAPLDNWVNLKVPETELGRFCLQQRVELLGRDGRTAVTGTVVDISRKAEFATTRATSERGDDADIISFNVKVQVNDAALRPGMRFRLAEERL